MVKTSNVQVGMNLHLNCMICLEKHMHFGKNDGSPKQGLLFEMKNRAKARFKDAIVFIRRNEDALRKESLAKKLFCVKMTRHFGKKLN